MRSMIKCGLHAVRKEMKRFLDSFRPLEEPLPQPPAAGRPETESKRSTRLAEAIVCDTKYVSKKTGARCSCSGCAGQGDTQLCEALPLCLDGELGNLIFVEAPKEQTNG